MNKRISFIIPVYNTPIDSFSMCISSVLSASYGINAEIIIVDDGSQEACWKLYSEYLSKIIFPNIKIIRQENKGVSIARNVGIEVATGEYIMFVDADDTVLPDIPIKCSEESDWVIYNYFFRKGKSKNRKVNSIDCDQGMVDHQNLLWAFINGKLRNVWGNLYRRDFLLLHGIWFESAYLQGEDLEFNFRMLSSKPRVEYIQQEIYQYNFDSQTALSRWRNSPEQMIDNATMRYVKKTAYLNEYFPNEYETTRKELTIDRIHAIFNNCIDLCSVGANNKTLEKKIENLMNELTLPERVDVLTSVCYYLVVNQKWRWIKIIANIRLLYLRIMRY